MKRADEMVLVLVLLTGNERQTRRHCQNLKSVHTLNFTIQQHEFTFSGMRYHDVTVIMLF